MTNPDPITSSVVDGDGDILVELFEREAERRGRLIEVFGIARRKGRENSLFAEALKNAASRCRTQKVAHHDGDQNLKGKRSV